MNNKDVYANLDQLIDRLDISQLSQVFNQMLRFDKQPDAWKTQEQAMYAGTLSAVQKRRFLASKDLMQAFDTGPN